MQSLVKSLFRSTPAFYSPVQMRSFTFHNSFRCASVVEVEQQKRIKEKQIADLLKAELKATYVKIEDTSVGGSACGQMYRMVVQSPVFNDKSRVEQHQLVNNVLSPVFKDVHGYNLKTLVLEEQKKEEPPKEEVKKEEPQQQQEQVTNK